VEGGAFQCDPDGAEDLVTHVHCLQPRQRSRESGRASRRAGCLELFAIQLKRSGPGKIQGSREPDPAIGQRVCNGLELSDRAAELLARTRVLDGGLYQALSRGGKVGSEPGVGQSQRPVDRGHLFAAHQLDPTQWISSQGLDRRDRAARLRAKDDVSPSLEEDLGLASPRQ
jgi:hypothetical protein